MQPPKTLADLAPSLVKRGNAPALVSFERRKKQVLSHRELADAVLRLAAGLQKEGLSRGGRAAVIGPNSPGWIIACLGILAAGATVVLIDGQLSASGIARQVKASGARFVFTTRQLWKDLSKTRGLKGRKFYLLEGASGKAKSWKSLLAKAPAGPALVKESDTALLLFTSGTTGVPKVVPLSHGNIASNVQALHEAGLIKPADKVVLPLPLHHTYPFTVGVLGVLLSGAALVLPEGAAGPALQQALAEGEATALLGVPRLYEALAEVIEARAAQGGTAARHVFRAMLAASIALRRVTGIRAGRLIFRMLHRKFGPRLCLLGCGGAKLDSKTEWMLEGLGWRVLTGYGLTETSPILTFNVPGKSRVGSTGRPLPGVEIRIEAKGKERKGEILARGPNVFKGYANNAAATKAAFAAGGWFRTGDLGFLDQEGFLHVLGRVKEMIVLPSGENIFPEDIEAAYLQSPLFAEVAVLERKGKLVALVAPDLDALRKAGTGQARDLVRDTLDAASRKLPSYQRLADYRIVRESLPRTRLGKLKRHRLPEIWERAGRPEPRKQAARLSPADRELLSKPLAGEVWEWLNGRFRDEKISLDTGFQFDLGLDSLAWIGLTLELQERFGIALTDEEVASIVTVRDLLKTVLKAKKGEVKRPALGPKEARWLDPPGPLKRTSFLALYALNLAIMRLFFRLKVWGAENLPRKGAYLIAPRHTSLLDPPAVMAALPYHVLRRTYWAGWASYLFTNPITRFISHGAKVLPVDPNRRPLATLALAKAVLGRGHPLVWFPEGERARTDEILPFKGGTGVLIKEAGVPAVPVMITGTLEALPRGRLMPRLKAVSVVFGKPVAVRELIAEGKGKGLEQKIADGLRKHLAALKA